MGLKNSSIGILGVDLDGIRLSEDNNFDINDPESITQVRLLSWCNKFKKRKTLKGDINNTCSMAFKKMVEFVLVRRREKRNRTNFYC